MIGTNEIRVLRGLVSEPPPELASLIQRLTEWRGSYLEEFREWMSGWEHLMDGMLIEFAAVLAVIKPIALPQFVPDWRVLVLGLAQRMYRAPRHIFDKEMPEEYKELSASYSEFVMEADAMGEDLIEFVISMEKGDLEDATDLFRDLSEGLARLETMLTTRWRAIARLFRQLEM